MKTSNGNILKERLSISDQQNIIKDQQIEKLQKLLDQQQILTLQANKKIEELELKSLIGQSLFILVNRN